MENKLQEGLLVLRTHLESLQPDDEPLLYHDPKTQLGTTFADRLLREHRLWNRSEVKNSDFVDGKCEAGGDSRHDAVEIKFSHCYGRYLVAARDIAAGEVIVHEQPLLITPKVNSEPTCLACLKLLGSDWDGCRQCGGPMCSEPCDGHYHGTQECNLIRRIGLKHFLHPESHIFELNMILGPLRALLLIQESAAARELFFALQSHVEKRKKMQIGHIVEEHIVKVLQARLGLQVEPELIHRLCGVLDTNTFEISLDNSRLGRAIFVVPAMMNHSCLNNTQRWYLNGNMIVRASVDIPRGAPILTNYTQSLWGTAARSAHLFGYKMVICKCDRCSDPTELGSHISSIPCRECQALMVPPDGSSSPWQCLSCGKSIDASNIELIVRAGAVALSHLPRDDTQAIMSTLAHLSRLLGHSHFIVAQIKYALIQAIMTRPLTDVDSTDLTRVLDLTRELLKLVSLVDPGLTRFRGVLLLEQTRSWCELLERRRGSDVGAEVCQDVSGGTGDDLGAEESTGDDSGAEESTGDDSGAEESTGDDTGPEEGIGDDTGAEESIGDDKGAEESIGHDTGAEESIGDDTGAEESIELNGNECTASHSHFTHQVQMLLSQVADCEFLLQYDLRLPDVLKLYQRLQHLL